MIKDELIADFERALEANHREIREKREKMISDTGRALSPNRRKYLRKLAIERLRKEVKKG